MDATVADGRTGTIVARHRVIVADPPWRFGDRLPGASRGASKNYRTGDVSYIVRAYNVAAMTAPNAVLFLWRVSAMPGEALDVMRAWGFTPKTEIVWRKLTKSGKPWFGMGRYVRATHETCLIGVRGRCFPKSRSVRSMFEAPVGAHSAKPDRFFEIVEELYDGPYLELFARRSRPGWTCLGDELR